VGKPEGRRPLGNPGVCGRIILTLIYKKWNGWHALDWSSSRQGQIVGPCKCGNKPWGSINAENFFTSWETSASEEGFCFMDTRKSVGLQCMIKTGARN
jgi:hypothetical protein